MRKNKSHPDKAYIVVTPILGAKDVEAHLIHWDGRLLATTMTRDPFYAFSDLWLTKPELREKYGHMKVDAHAYTIFQFMSRHRDVWNRFETLRAGVGV